MEENFEELTDKELISELKPDLIARLRWLEIEYDQSDDGGLYWAYRRYGELLKELMRRHDIDIDELKSF